VLLTGRAPPGQWPLSLPDLRSRIRSYPAIAIKEPDEELLAAVLLKHFADRQIAVAPDVIPFVVARMERSMAAAELIAAHIDRLALAEHRKITRAFAAKVLKDFNLAEGGSSDDL
jgi:chromosomal replication initiation ATPase DnaA